MSHFLRLILIMVGFGLLGGFVNYYYNEAKSESRVLRYFTRDLIKSLLTGVAASLLVPLFLNMISSDIIQNSETDFTKLLVFSGFCLIASISSKAFIRTLSNSLLERVSRVEEDVESVKKEVNPIVLTHIETDELQPVSEEDPPGSCPVARKTLDEAERELYMVLKALACSNLTYRTVNGLARETSLNAQDVRRIVEDCITKGYVGKLTRDAGFKFHITAAGRKRLASLCGAEEE